MSDPRAALAAELTAVFAAAVAACDPRSAVVEALGPPPLGRVWLCAAGKAAAAMADGALAAWGDAIVGGLVVVPDGVAVAPALARLDVRRAAHPEPDLRSEAAGRAALALAEAVGPGELLLALISGGASALLAVPAPGLDLAGKRQAIGAVMRAGAPIAAINAARIARSAIKGGRLAAACRGRVWTLVVSDVPGDDPAVVGSGPTVGPLAGARPGDRLAVVAGLGRLREAAAAAATVRGAAVTVAPRELCGDLAAAAAEVEAAIASLAPGGWWIAGGEWTVALGPRVGRGGRASELALRLARGLTGDVVVLVGASDGVDGTGPDAGAIVDATTWAAVGDGERALAAHDSGAVLAAIGRALTTGPTGTNHADLVIAARPVPSCGT